LVPFFLQPNATRIDDKYRQDDRQTQRRHQAKLALELLLAFTASFFAPR
jgi:hypothetical protein